MVRGQMPKKAALISEAGVYQQRGIVIFFTVSQLSTLNAQLLRGLFMG
jgi:hypothetical protein